LSPAKPWEGSASIRRATASTARPHCACGPRTSRGSRTRRAARGRIQVGQLADLIVPDRDYFSCAEDEIADTTSELTIVGGKVVYGAGGFASLDESAPPPAMPDWSPVRTFGGYAAWGDPRGAGQPALHRELAMTCACANACGIHGQDHAVAWSGRLPIADLKSFWGALGCACWAV
jgi:Amidohydrolase family